VGIGGKTWGKEASLKT